MSEYLSHSLRFVNNVYNMLTQSCINPSKPITFLTQSLAYYTTTKSLNNNSEITITLTLRFVDLIFYLFKLKNIHNILFKNLLLKSII